jgi:hypothetical protein
MIASRLKLPPPRERTRWGRRHSGLRQETGSPPWCRAMQHDKFGDALSVRDAESPRTPLKGPPPRQDLRPTTGREGVPGRNPPQPPRSDRGRAVLGDDSRSHGVAGRSGEPVPAEGAGDRHPGIDRGRRHYDRRGGHDHVSSAQRWLTSVQIPRRPADRTMNPRVHRSSFTQARGLFSRYHTPVEGE